MASGPSEVLGELLSAVAEDRGPLSAHVETS